MFLKKYKLSNPDKVYNKYNKKEKNANEGIFSHARLCLFKKNCWRSLHVLLLLFLNIISTQHDFQKDEANPNRKEKKNYRIN